MVAGTVLGVFIFFAVMASFFSYLPTCLMP
jgi:hypothetical protein